MYSLGVRGREANTLKIRLTLCSLICHFWFVANSGRGKRIGGLGSRKPVNSDGDDVGGLSAGEF